MRFRAAVAPGLALIMLMLWLLGGTALLSGCGTGADTGTGAPGAGGGAAAGTGNGAGTGTSGSAGSGSRTASMNADEALFQIASPDGVIRPVSLDELKRLPSLKLDMPGSEEGPKLADVLLQAGIADYSQVTITGSSGSIVLTKDQVTGRVILDYTNRGTMKLASPDIPKDQWVKDITNIEVK